jgi:hypothetical protein
LAFRRLRALQWKSVVPEFAPTSAAMISRDYFALRTSIFVRRLTDRTNASAHVKAAPGCIVLPAPSIRQPAKQEQRKRQKPRIEFVLSLNPTQNLHSKKKTALSAVTYASKSGGNGPKICPVLHRVIHKPIHRRIKPGLLPIEDAIPKPLRRKGWTGIATISQFIFEKKKRPPTEAASR